MSDIEVVVPAGVEPGDCFLVNVAGGRRAVAGAWSLRVRDYPDVAVTIRVDS